MADIHVGGNGKSDPFQFTLRFLEKKAMIITEFKEVDEYLKAH